MKPHRSPCRVVPDHHTAFWQALWAKDGWDYVTQDPVSGVSVVGLEYPGHLDPAAVLMAYVGECDPPAEWGVGDHVVVVLDDQGRKWEPGVGALVCHDDDDTEDRRVGLLDLVALN